MPTYEYCRKVQNTAFYVGLLCGILLGALTFMALPR